MRILFVLKQMGYVRHFDTVVRALAERGHSVRLAYQDGEHGVPPALEGYPNITATQCPSKRGDNWQEYASLVRRSGDYLRYLTPRFRGAGKLRARAFDKLVGTISNGVRAPGRGWSDVPLGLTASEIERLRGLIRTIEDTVPPDRSIVDFIGQQAPDLLLITPLIDIGSGQTDFIKAAREAGVPSAMVLFSWDNLSTKGLIHDVPDAVLVWNDLQRQEAMDLHGVPEDRIMVTGAPRFDTFFATRSLITREKFCGGLGFDPAQRIVAYLGSSKFVAEREEIFIDQWMDAVRTTPGLERANLLIKPHPDRHRDWPEEGERLVWETKGGPIRLRKHTPAGTAGVAVVRAPFSATQFLYECLFHSAAVVGLNTSAELEAGIVGRPVLTITVPDEYADGQESTLHFHYLLESSGGYVQTAPNLETHCMQLAGAVAGEFDRARIDEFITQFLRPRGINRPASKEMVRAIERIAKRRARATSALAPELAAAAEAAEPAVDDVEPAVDIVEPAAEAVEPAAAPRPGTAVLDYAPVHIMLIATSEAERNWRTQACRKEPWTVEWLERSIRSDAVLYDVGANVGAFTLIAAKRTPTATVVAFEPGYASFAHLCDNLMLNGVVDAVIPVPMPLWSRTGMMSLKYKSTEAGQSRHTMREGGLRRGRSRARYTQPVFAYSLDDLVKQFGLPVPTHMKLDVDGAEVEVLTGAAATLKTPGLESLMVEYDNRFADQVATLLGAAGFHLARQIDRGKTKVEAPRYAEFRRTAV